jgi:IS30 family transposase
MMNIKDLPDEVDGRLVPGHWQGDLIIGAGGASAIGTLVERTTRLVLLVRMPTRKADVAASAFAGALNSIPAPLRKTLTHDQGKEMAEYCRLPNEVGITIFFADPHSPWQRPSNENTNGLLRQYFPKGTSLSEFTQDQLDAVAATLNDRPRRTLGFVTPNELFAKLVANLNDTTDVSHCSVRYGN